MLKIEKTDVYGWDAAIRGMRNPMNSWNNCDSIFDAGFGSNSFICGENDRSLMERLVKAGTDHRKFMRMIVVYVDITAPLYWWKEFDTYKVGTVANSCSTMHRIHAKEFTLDDFSHEHLWDTAKMQLESIIGVLNTFQNAFNHPNANGEYKKDCWWQMIQLLPSSYNQRRTLMLNYEVLSNIYRSRRNHKLDEWHTFCDWVESLPESHLITGKERCKDE